MKLKKTITTHETHTMRSTPKDYMVACVVVVMVVAACFPAAHLIGYQAIGLIFLVVISVLSLILGRGAVFFAAIISSTVWNFFFIPPIFTFHIHRVQDVIALAANLMVALVGATLITRIRKSQIDLLHSRERLKALNSFLESLNFAISIKDVVKRSEESFNHYFDAGIVIYLKEIEGNTLSPRAFGNASLFGPETFELALKQYASEQDVGGDFQLLRDPRGVFGVIGIRLGTNTPVNEELISLMRSFISQVTSALEREISVDFAKSREITQESEKLFSTILNSVSHELRTPIAVITTAVSNLMDPLTSGDPGVRRQITGELESAAKRLNFLVENILDMSRIESGRMKLNIRLCDPDDLVGMVLRILEPELADHPPNVVLNGEVAPLAGDISLLVQALVNVVHNAAVYSPPGTPVTITISMPSPEKIAMVVADRGPGVPEHTLGRLFDKFYRVPGSRSGGTGLGLTITRAIVEAHHGTIAANNNPGGGLAVTLEFPVAEQDWTHLPINENTFNPESTEEYGNQP
jgi:two-component system sensor histidine kinase KdpD